MIWLWVVVLVIVIGAVAVLAAGRDTSMAEAYEDRPDRAVPTGRALTAADLQTIRFTTAVRGYRMDEVDAFIDQLRADLLARETEASRAASRVDDEPANLASAPAASDAHDSTDGPAVSEAEKLGVQPVDEQPDAEGAQHAATVDGTAAETDGPAGPETTDPDVDSEAAPGRHEASEPS